VNAVYQQLQDRVDNEDHRGWSVKMVADLEDEVKAMDPDADDYSEERATAMLKKLAVMKKKVKNQIDGGRQFVSFSLSPISLPYSLSLSFLLSLPLSLTLSLSILFSLARSPSFSLFLSLSLSPSFFLSTNYYHSLLLASLYSPHTHTHQQVQLSARMEAANLCLPQPSATRN
jgi:hypothetical protein